MRKQATGTVAFMMSAAIVSKLLGMLRSILLASACGTGDDACAFLAAQRIPLSFFDMLFGAAIAGCFIPVFNRCAATCAEDSEKRLRDFASAFFCVVASASGLLALAGIVFAPTVITLAAPGLEGGVKETAVVLLRIMFPMVIFTGCTFTLVGIMQSRGKFILPALISIISNLGIIIYFLFINKPLGENGIYGLAFAYLISWFIQFLTLLIPLVRSGFGLRVLFDFKNAYLRKALKTLPAVMVGSWLSPAGLLISTFFLSYSSDGGGIAVYDYAYTIFVIAAGVITYGICNYVFPSLSRLHGEGDGEAFNASLSKALISLIAVIIPVMLGLALLSTEIICIIYYRGSFNAEAVLSASEAMKLLAFLMPAFCLSEIFNRAFLAADNRHIPVLSSVSGISAGIAFSYLGVFVWKLSVIGAVLGYAAGQLVSAAVYLFAAFLKMRGIFKSDTLLRVLKSLCCGAVSALVMHFIYGAFDADPIHSGIFKNILLCSIVFTAGVVVYLLCGVLCGAFGITLKSTKKEG